MVNYSNGKVYKIEPLTEHEDNEIYIGSTTKKYLCQRLSTHRGYYRLWKQGKMNKLMSFELFDKYGLENCVITLIELVEAKDKDELLSKEAYYIRNMKCLNKHIPLNTWNEYYDKNKEIIKDRANQYYKENKQHVLEKVKQYSKNNSDKLKDYRRDYRLKNKESIERYREANREIFNEKQREKRRLKKLETVKNI